MSDTSGDRLAVAKTYKLFVGGAFPRSESGRTYQVTDHAGVFLANAARGSRKDARDAVSAARKAFGGWSGATAYNKGQVIYRIAEMLEGRRAQFVELLESAGEKHATATVDASIDRIVHYAGWTDKLAAVFGGANPVAGPFFSFSTPEPTGVVAAVAPADDSLLGLVSVIAPIITSGNTVVVIASQRRPLPAVALAEVLATSDLPGGVVNILTGDPAEMMPHLAAHGGRQRPRPDGRRRRSADLPRAGRRGHREAGLRAVRFGFPERPGYRSAARVPGDQDRLASHRRPLPRWGRRVLRVRTW